MLASLVILMLATALLTSAVPAMFRHREYVAGSVAAVCGLVSIVQVFIVTLF